MRYRRLFLVLLVLMTVGLLAWLDRMFLLEHAATLWIVSDPLKPADAAVVLGGGVEDRPFAVARYYKAGLVHKILLSNDHEGPAEKLGVIKPDATANREVLLQLGVPDDAIELFGEDLKNTHDEALALRDWARSNGAHSLIVPTEIFFTRRVRWMLHNALGDDVTVMIPALDPPEYSRDNWWRGPEGIIAFQNEVLKYAYYRLRY
jgi:uncharacterized SAM-binding protein YcdF (DUF218 family)